MKRLLPLCAVLVQLSSVAAAEPGYAELVRRFADEMISQGTDRWGREHSPQFASMLLRSSPPELMPDAVFTGAPSGVKPDARAEPPQHLQGQQSRSQDHLPGRGRRGRCRPVPTALHGQSRHGRFPVCPRPPTRRCPGFWRMPRCTTGCSPGASIRGGTSAGSGPTTAMPLTGNTSSTADGPSGTASWPCSPGPVRRSTCFSPAIPLLLEHAQSRPARNSRSASPMAAGSARQ